MTFLYSIFWIFFQISLPLRFWFETFSKSIFAFSQIPSVFCKQRFEKVHTAGCECSKSALSKGGIAGLIGRFGGAQTLSQGIEGAFQKCYSQSPYAFPQTKMDKVKKKIFKIKFIFWFFYRYLFIEKFCFFDIENIFYKLKLNVRSVCSKFF